MSNNEQRAMTNKQIYQQISEGADRVEQAIAEYHKVTRFYILLGALIRTMGKDFANAKHMAEVISRTDWVGSAEGWGKLFERGRATALSREPPNYH
jgi:hypothetical protein